MRSLAVIPIATGVLRADLLHMHQERDEPFRAFAARVRGKAETCEFKATCSCGNDVNYTDHAIRDILLSGISDIDIRREILGTQGVPQKSIKEMARNALPSLSMSAISSFRNQQRKPSASHMSVPPSTERSKQAPCPDCKKPYHLFTEGAKGWNVQPHSVCIDCYRAKRRRGRRQGNPPPAPPPPPATVQAMELGPVSQIAASHLNVGNQRSRRRKRQQVSVANKDNGKSRHGNLDHHIFTKGAWRRAHLRDHPKVAITISNDTSSPRNISKSNSSVTADVSAVADSGAQSDLWSLKDYLAHGFSRDNLVPVALSLSAANRSPIAYASAFFAKISTCSRQGKRATYEAVFVSKRKCCQH